MGKGEIKESRLYMALMMRAPNHRLLKNGTKIFMIPVEAAPRERDELMESQVYYWTKFLAERYESFDDAVTEVQTWLRQFCINDPSRRIWVEQAANKAGFKYRDELKMKQAEGKKVIGVSLRSLFNGFFGIGD